MGEGESEGEGVGCKARGGSRKAYLERWSDYYVLDRLVRDAVINLGLTVQLGFGI